MAYYNKRYKRPTNSAQKTAKVASVTSIPAQYTQVHADLMAYNGTFGFLLDLRSKFIKYGSLSDKQWESAKKCLTPKTAPVVDKSKILVPYCNVPITITAYQARKVAKMNNWPFNPCTLRVTSINWVDRKYLSLNVKIDWTGNVTSCRCCGKALSDWRSQATGVGPVCVKGTGIPYIKDRNEVAAFQKSMEDLCDKLGEVTIEVSKWAFDSGLHEVEQAIYLVNPAPPVPPTPQTAAFAPVMSVASRYAVAGSVNPPATSTNVCYMSIERCKYDRFLKVFTTNAIDKEFYLDRLMKIPESVVVFNAKTSINKEFRYSHYDMSRGYCFCDSEYTLYVSVNVI